MNEATTTNNSRKVFIVHGRNEEAAKAMYQFLRALDLAPIEFEQLTADMGGSPYVGDVIRKGLNDAQAAIVLLTPDDEARLKAQFRQSQDDDKFACQARPNVLIEAGMALALDEAHTIIVAIGDVAIPSDILGRHLVKMNNTPAMRNQLAARLAAAGCQVNRDGKAWYDDGDFDGCCKENDAPHVPLHPVDEVMGISPPPRRIKPSDVGKSYPDRK